MTDYKEIHVVRLSDERFVESVLAPGRDTVDDSRLDPKTHYLVRLGPASAIDAAPSSYQSSVGCALAAGASVDEIVGTLVAVASTVGVARVVSCSRAGAGAQVMTWMPHSSRRARPRVNVTSAGVPHRVGRRTLRRLAEHRLTRRLPQLYSARAARRVAGHPAAVGATRTVRPGGDRAAALSSGRMSARRGRDDGRESPRA